MNPKMKVALEKAKAMANTTAGRVMMVGAPLASTAGISAFAAEGDAVGSSVTAATGVFSSVLSILTDNPIMLVFIGASLIPVGFKIFSAGKRAAK